MATGTLVDHLEETRDALRDSLVQDAQDLHTAVGDRPYGEAKLKEREKALRLLPPWFVLGQANLQHLAPDGKHPWWQMLAMRNADQRGGEPDRKGTVAFDQEMRRLHAEYPGAHLEGMTPELVQAYAQVLAMGLHSGQVQAPLGETTGKASTP